MDSICAQTLDLTALGDAEFTFFQRMIHEQAGIALNDGKRALVASRLGGRLHQLGLDHFADYCRHVLRDSGERQVMVDLLTTNETSFFRESRHFEFLEGVIGEFRGGVPLRAWSAACSSGEEPYSLAMTLAAGTPLWEITATDISTRMLAIAQRGIYPLDAARRIPEGYLSRYCLKGTGKFAGYFSVQPALRDKVEFLQLNLAGPWPQLGPFHLIFVRNVMIYFDAETKRRLVEKLRRHLLPGGYLFVGHAESMSVGDPRFQSVRPAIYQLRA